MKKFFKQHRIFIGILLIWILLQFFLYTTTGLRNYDKSEFFFYSGLPIFLFCIYLCFKKELRNFAIKIQLKKLLKIKILIPVVTYIIWIIVQIKLLSIWENYKIDEYFFPFTKSKYHPFADLRYYNLSEFLVYSITPLLIFFFFYFLYIIRKKKVI